MTKRELIEEVVHVRSALPRREVEALVNGIFDTLAEALARGERIEIRGFGSFIVKRRNAREGLNPKTGQAVSVEAKRVAFFKAGKELKLRVDSGSTAAGAPEPVVAVAPPLRSQPPARKPASATVATGSAIDGHASYGIAAAGGEE